MSQCPEEETTQHYDASKSNGVIGDSEILILALFKDNEVQTNNKVSSDAFPSRRLVKREASIARCQFTSREEFESYVIIPGTAREKGFKGVATISAQLIREIEYPSTQNAKKRYQAFCVIDRVDNANESDGHGVISYCDAITEHLSGNTIGTYKAALRAELAKRFSEVISLDDFYAASKTD